MKVGSEEPKYPERAVAIAFDSALKTVTVIPVTGPYWPFNEVCEAWKCKRLYYGPEDVIRALVLQNVVKLSLNPRFNYFRVDIRSGDVVQINAFFADSFVPIQIWRSGQNYFTNGTGAFSASGELDGDSRIRIETTEKYETDQRHRRDNLVLRAAKIRCRHCGLVAIESCIYVKVLDSGSVIFRCSCGAVP